MRLLLVDDEQPARDRLRRLLEAFPEVTIVAEAEDGPQAMEAIAEHRPDVCFLDIEMPGCSGLDVAASIEQDGPAIVFCTAYDEHAVDAFELQAADYLLKPVNRTRLARTMERLEQPQRATTPATSLSPQRFLGKKGSRFVIVPAEEVLYFGTEDGLTLLQTAEAQYWMQPTLAELEERLDGNAFFRISRSVIVRVDAIREIQSTAGGQGLVRLADDTELDVSRRRFRPLLERIEG